MSNAPQGFSLAPPPPPPEVQHEAFVSAANYEIDPAEEAPASRIEAPSNLVRAGTIHRQNSFISAGREDLEN